MAEQQYYYGTGRRKTAVARVRLIPGPGAIIVNGKPMEEVFARETHRVEILEPLKRLGREGRFSATIKCAGGGISGWAGAIQMGIARALVASDPSLKPLLKRPENLLTRDARMKERKKPGLKRARKAPQFTKR
ncbi:30S ribosomal protein S9 [Tepidiforma flava]|jgi:small subunit ribosomal protein S9|uniref:Small ribosomal subunit protein uS9 n=1 Tax=Tepidiforma flava TaxID=3004094 RepID=A0ABY7M7V6_9CHLR|nr:MULTISPECIES: 30S ribosomal protein S9 [Tepidiforma]MCX7618685.1 30S ribosomal protein S9 [Tepidiforma sp.]WBL36621.1 30S ribosomal protein S9 [Tepidiforma flava]GIW19346.1 MAG: 30S ribosomal protein S9 [Tepidiforma sp.]